MSSTKKALMRPLLLTFRNDDLESAFEHYVYTQTHRLGDIRFFFVTTIVLFAVSIKTALEQDFRLLPALPYLCTTLLTALMWRVYHSSSTPDVLRLRRYMSVIFRIAIALAGSVTSHYMKWIYAFVPNPVAVTLQFLMVTETLSNLPYAFGMTLKFQHHLPTHFITYLIFLFSKAPVMCEKISESRGGPIFYKIDASVDAFFEFSYSFLKSTIGIFDNTAPPNKIPCLHLSAFLMMFFSTGCVSFLLWKSERSARVRFLMSQQQTHRHSFTPPNPSSSLSDCISCLIFFTLATLYWRWSTLLTTMVIQWTP